VTLLAEAPVRQIWRATRHVDAPPARTFRPDIQGLRAIAVVEVVLYHANLGVRAGFVGVDVFFVISGYLISTQLLELFSRVRGNAFLEFYTRRIRRLLPASLAVTVFTVVAFRFLGPPLEVHSVGVDGLFTAIYLFNYRLVVEGTQYLHASSPPSPLQHYWSLAVEEQFYLIWPFAIFASSLIFGRRARRYALGLLLVAVVGYSLYLSIRLTPGSPSFAYFSLPTRAWELGIGAFLALCRQELRRWRGPSRDVVAWVGIIGSIAPAFILSANTPYPGYAAVFPVLAAAFVIATGVAEPARAEHILTEPAIQGIGKISYSWYLWHWPLLILAPFVLGHALNWERRFDVIAISLVIAILSYHLLEDPARRSKRSRLAWLRSGAIMTAATVAVVVLVIANPPVVQGQGQAVVLQPLAISNTAIASVQTVLATSAKTTALPRNLTPTLANAANDLPISSQHGCFLDLTQLSQPLCAYGDLAAKRTAVLFGDSHMQQWLPGIAAAARQDHWRIIALNKASCPVADVTIFQAELQRKYTQCNPWRSAAISRIAALRPALIIASQSDENSGSLPVATWASGTASVVAELAKIAPVDFILDDPNPADGMVIPDCLSSHLKAALECDYSPKHLSDPEKRRAVSAAVAKVGARIVDPKSWMCTPDVCPPVAGNILIYRDQAHVTATFSTWLAPVFEGLLPKAAPEETVAGHPRSAPKHLVSPRSPNNHNSHSKEAVKAQKTGKLAKAQTGTRR
jgi:peptidoglycan/LPS O-acetylase OafA/YrhL